MRTDFSQQGTVGNLSLSSINQQNWSGDSITWNVKLNPSVPLDLSIKSAANSMNLDLSQMKLESLGLETNAGTCDLKLPPPAGILEADVQANVGNVEITVPDSAAVK